MNWTIETETISKHYGDVTAVDGLSLRVAEGEIYAFLGLNGAGKTTTIRMLLGMIKPTTRERHRPREARPLGQPGTLGAGGIPGRNAACLPRVDRLREPGSCPAAAPGDTPESRQPGHRAPGTGSLCRTEDGYAFPGECPAPGARQSPAAQPEIDPFGRAGQRPGSRPGSSRSAPCCSS